MSSISNQTDLETDTYHMDQSSPSGKANISLNEKQKKALGISAAALLLGGSAWVIAQKTLEKVEPSANPEEPITNQLPVDIDVAGNVTDTMSFEQAFQTARDEVGVGGIFNWHGSWYNTFSKTEWTDLSLQQRQEFTELITQEHLPVRPYQHAVLADSGSANESQVEEPTIIEGHLNGQRVMGLDFDVDGTIDTLVLEGEDGYTYRVVDAVGDDGLDTFFRYDSLTGELVEVDKMEQPFILTNDQFSQGLEESMSKEVVDSILEPEVIIPDTSDIIPASESEGVLDGDDQIYLTNSYSSDDDTYSNNGDVQDMDE